MGNKTGATRLGFGLLLKFFEQEGRFPRHAGEVPRAAVDYMAGQVKVDAALFSEYRWSGSTIEYHRAQVREALGFRESTRADEDVLAGWLAKKICPMVFTDEGLRAALLPRCRKLKIEPPGRMDRIVGAGRARFERKFCLHVLNGLSADSARSLWELATGEDGFLLELKSDPGRLGLETLLEEIVKPRRAKTLGLPADLFGGYSDRLVASWRARAMASHPSDFAANPPATRLTLMAALAWSRTTEITDALVDLFIGLVSKINTRAERKAERAIEAESPTRLVVTFDDAPGAGPSRESSVVTFLVEPHEDIVRLTVTHENLPNQAMLNGIAHGWPAVLTNLKSLLETGEVLPQAPWEMYRAHA